ncbi:hypothetical protein AQUCO_04100151v1 [Aquilegia coerulea]|uniref:Uncharacterized protein n=1 Tax=Aquilegia coerulea TaxID=218851 RepID=A0A2G5CQF7_AQUCA|nr:hypothetical protein AQUCO_04100151v1 [Aquilegia coerulea]
MQSFLTQHLQDVVSFLLFSVLTTRSSEKLYIDKPVAFTDSNFCKSHFTISSDHLQVASIIGKVGSS